MPDVTRVTMVGGGVMGGAIVDGLLALGEVEVSIVEADPDRARSWKNRAGATVVELREGIADADVVFLAVKPHQIVDVLTSAVTAFSPGTIVVSIAAGVPLEVLEQHVPAGVRVVRTMPNMPMRVGRGVVGMSAGSGCEAPQVDLVRKLLEPVALVVPVPEELLDSLTAASGSGPAYVFYLAEAMKLGAIDLGLSEEMANTLVAETIMGAALLLIERPDDAVGLRASITSKGGTTAAATAVFDEADVRGIVIRAMHANRNRARELADESR